MRALTALERLEAAATRVVAALPRALKRRIAGEPIRRDGLELDLNTQVLIKLAERNLRPLRGLSLAEARENLRHTVRVLEGAPVPLVDTSELTVAGAEGPLRARLYVPHGEREQAEPAPLLVYYHGGGWACGDLDSHEQPCRMLARSSGACVLSVDYRLAPEHPFPAAVDDALAAFRDAVARAEELRVDPERIAVAGDSAGGHLAAVTCQLSAADGGPAPAFQLLIYPATDFSREAPSRLLFAEGFILTKEDMDWYEEHFLTSSSDRSDPRLSPLLAEDLSGVAPALVVTAGFDPLRDEGEAYARRLRDAGVHTILRRHPGYVHGFIHALAFGGASGEALAEMGGVLRASLAAPALVRR